MVVPTVLISPPLFFTVRGRHESADFDVKLSGFDGALPDFLGSMPKLQQLDLAGNKLQGPVPETICAVSNSSLTDLLLSYNSLSGDLVLDNCANLIAVDVKVHTVALVSLSMI